MKVGRYWGWRMRRERFEDLSALLAREALDVHVERDEGTIWGLWEMVRLPVVAYLLQVHLSHQDGIVSCFDGHGGVPEIIEVVSLSAGDGVWEIARLRQKVLRLQEPMFNLMHARRWSEALGGVR